MYPIVNIFGKLISSYMLCAMVGVLVAGSLAYVLADKRNLRPVDMLEVLGVAAIGVIVGSHLLYALTNIQYAAQLSLLELFGGSVFYGGMLGGVLVGLLYVKKRKYNLTIYGDIAACFIPLFHSIARIGCFLGGCCYGIESNFGFIMTHSLGDGDGVRRFPVELMESLWLIILFAVIFFGFYRKRKWKGYLINLYLCAYAVIRFFDECFRGDLIRGIYGPFSTSQWISLFILAGHIIWFILLKTGKCQPKVIEDDPEPIVYYAYPQGPGGEGEGK